MNEQRYQQFEGAVASLDVDRAAARERWLGWVGIALIVVGAGLGGIAYFGSTGADGDLAQRDMIVLGLWAVSITVIGVGLFVRYSVVRFFRFWAARITYEISRATADEAAPAAAEPEIPA